MYSFLIDEDNETVYLTQQVLSSGVDQKASLNFYVGDSPYQTNKEFEVSFADYHSTTMPLEEDKIQKLCQVHRRILQKQKKQSSKSEEKYNDES